MKTNNLKIYLLIILLINSKIIFSQIPVIVAPQPATMNINGFQQNNSYQSVNPMQYYQQQQQYQQQLQQQQIMQEVQYYEQLRLQQQQLIEEAQKLSQQNEIQYELPSFEGETGTENFYNAFNEINSMLNGSQTLDLKKAVFLTENAFLDNQLKYTDFENRIDQDVKFAKLFMQQSKYKNQENLAKNLSLFQFMSDTISYYDYSIENQIYHAPVNYDFDDFCGKSDWTKMFVAKLLGSGNGQCHSMPLLYLIYAQEIGTEAYLTFSPSHSYVRIKDADNVWYNLELTSGMFITDAAIMASGYVKTEAIKSQIYMDTISTKQTIAYCMLDLAKGFYHKYGYDNFMLQCADTALKYSPNLIDAYQVKSDYYTLLFHHVATQLPEIQSLDELDSVLTVYPKAKEIYEKRNSLYETIDNLGYAEIPEIEYQKWLNSVGEQANKQENQTKILYIQNKVR